MEISKALLWNELADEYDKATGRTARTKRMEAVFDWAERQTDKFFVDPVEGTIHKIISLPNIACSGQETGAAKSDGESTPAVSCH